MSGRNFKISAKNFHCSNNTLFSGYFCREDTYSKEERMEPEEAKNSTGYSGCKKPCKDFMVPSEQWLKQGRAV
jgi:hypothetical protein